MHNAHRLKRAKLFMDTVVEIQVILDEMAPLADAKIKVDRAFEAFRLVEQACSRFDPESELRRACQVSQRPVQLSPYLFEPLKFALELAKLTQGKFDPAIGRLMEKQGFNHRYLTGDTIFSPSISLTATYQDIILDHYAHTLYLNQPLVIDLGAVAKGFAIDLAAGELQGLKGFSINAGGDIFASGTDHDEAPWKIGIQHPYEKDQIIDVIEISNKAICTSGSYERRNAHSTGMHHIIDPMTKQSPNELVSSSVVAPYAMMADAFSTTSFLLGREEGKNFIENMGLQGLLITSTLQMERIGGL